MTLKIIDSPLHLQWEQSKHYKMIKRPQDLVNIHKDHSWIKSPNVQVAQMSALALKYKKTVFKATIQFQEPH